MLTIWGTPTSPYVRRTRIVAAELGLPSTLRNTNDEGVQDELVAVCPTWKIPTVRFPDGRVIWDSAILHDVLLAATPGVIPAQDLDGRLRIAAIDAGLDAAIALFYMKRDAVDLGVPYLVKQRARIDAAMRWVIGEVEAGRVGQSLTLDTIALVTTLEWFRLRSAWPVEDPALIAVLQRWSERASFVGTRPPG